MNSGILNLLEFDKVRQKIVKYAKTENAKSLIHNLRPFLLWKKLIKI